MSLKIHKCFSQRDKLKIINAYEAGRSRSEIMHEYGLPLSSYYNIISNKATVKQQCLQGKGNVRRNRRADFPNVERCLLHWINQKMGHGNLLKGPTVKAKAKLFSVKLGIDDFSASNGWLDGFKKRHRLIFSRARYGKDRIATTNDCRHDTAWADCFTSLLDEFEANDIYSIAVTGLFYKCMPEQIFKYKLKDCRDGEDAHERLTVLLCANLTGTDKLPILIIGQSSRSECFVGTKHQSVNYECNSNAWITRTIFVSWLTQVNETMSTNKKQIVLLLNHSIIHSMLPNLPNVKIVLQPSKSSTYVVQPLHKKLIENFKMNFRADVVTYLLECQKTQTKPDTNLSHAFPAAARAWDNISSDTIVNCFMQAGCWPYALCDSLSQHEEKGDPIWPNESDWEELVLHEPKPSFQDYVRVDENVAVTGMLTDDDIVEMVINQCQKHDEKEEGNVTLNTKQFLAARKEILRKNGRRIKTPISDIKNQQLKANKCNDTVIEQRQTLVQKLEALNALETLQKFFEQHIDRNATTFDILNELKAHVKNI
ncbi:tigger transposable element-derived protein 6-like [Anopheles funestus]|uniref:tigger transposable element-derived protein 6-like n=1 Tax=Anopheles funestus TaxID=62324 RepID=UPI0020C68526|nr:tigger transposable element-derived protein 6-like [Anopheles funestus]